MVMVMVKMLPVVLFLSLEQQLSKLTVSQHQDMHVKHIALFTFHSNLMT